MCGNRLCGRAHLELSAGWWARDVALGKVGHWRLHSPHSLSQVGRGGRKKEAHPKEGQKGPLPKIHLLKRYLGEVSCS